MDYVGKECEHCGGSSENVKVVVLMDGTVNGWVTTATDHAVVTHSGHLSISRSTPCPAIRDRLVECARPHPPLRSPQRAQMTQDFIPLRMDNSTGSKLFWIAIIFISSTKYLKQSSLICIRTADSFNSFRSQLKTCSQDIVAGTLSAPLIPLAGLSRVINSLLTYFIALHARGIQETVRYFPGLFVAFNSSARRIPSSPSWQHQKKVG